MKRRKDIYDITAKIQETLARNDELEKIAQEKKSLEISIYHEELEHQNRELLRAQQDLLEMQRELAVSREHYYQMFQEAPVAHAVIDPEHFILSINLEFCLLFSNTVENLVGSQFKNLIAAASQDQLYIYFRQLTQGKLSNVMEIDINTKKGLYTVKMHCNISEVYGEKKIHVTLVDITADKELQMERLLQANNRLFIALNSMDSAVNVVDA